MQTSDISSKCLNLRLPVEIHRELIKTKRKRFGRTSLHDLILICICNFLAADSNVIKADADATAKSPNEEFLEQCLFQKSEKSLT